MKKLLPVCYLFALVACTDLEINDPNSLHGPQGGAGAFTDFEGQKKRLVTRKWVLEGYESGQVRKNTVIEFKAQRNLSGNYILSGIGAVNFYEASYSLNGSDGIKITNLSVTEMGGPREDMSFEEAYFQRLIGMNTYLFRGNKLVLVDGKGTEMIFR